MRYLATRGTTDVKSFSYCFFKTFRPVYLWRVENFLKYWKVSKYYIQDCLRIFLLLSTFWIMTQVSKTSSIFSQKRNFYPPVKVVSFLMTFFDLKSNLKKRLLCHVPFQSESTLTESLIMSRNSLLEIGAVSEYKWQQRDSNPRPFNL